MQYNKVTWYSKAAAMILFIGLPFIAFFLGMKYQEALHPPMTKVITIEKGK